MSITVILVILTGVISFQAFSNISMQQQLLFHPVSIKERGQYYRFLTYGLVHGGWGHLLINMYVLYIFGEYTEPLYHYLFGPAMGRIAYLLFYLSAIVISSVPSYFQHQDNTLYRAVGASGATSAMVFAFVLLNPWQWFLFPPLPAVIFGVGYLWYSSYMDKKGGDNIGHNAHFWGAVYGLFFTIASIMAMKPEMMNVILERLLAGPTGGPFG